MSPWKSFPLQGTLQTPWATIFQDRLFSLAILCSIRTLELRGVTSLLDLLKSYTRVFRRSSLLKTTSASTFATIILQAYITKHFLNYNKSETVSLKGKHRTFKYHTTVKEQKEANIHIAHIKSEEEFVKIRKERDATLKFPHLTLPSLQINIAAGKLPEPEENGIVYLKLPVNTISNI